MRKWILWFLVAFGTANVARADVPIPLYMDVRHDSDAVSAFGDYIAGIGKGMLVYNVIAETEGRQPLFCPPPKLALNKENYRSILDGFIDKHAQIQKAAGATIEIAMLYALVDAFPCNRQGSAGSSR